MTRHRIDLAVFFVLATFIGAALLAALPTDHTIIFHAYILVVGALLLFGVVAEIRASVPHRRRSELSRALDVPPVESYALPELAKLEREVTLSIGNAFTFHTRLLPQLREIAQARVERAGRRPGP
jgi:hypothetical protein